MTRKKWTQEQKVQAVLRVSNGEKPKDVAERLGINESLLYKWRQRFDVGSAEKRAAKVAKKLAGAGTVRDAIVYLRHARTAINQSLVAGRIKAMDKAHLLTLLALQVLEGE